MNPLKRKQKTHRLNRLPILISNSFIWNDKIGYTGSQIIRPVRNTFGIYKHYGIIYGFDKNETLWIIENNLNGVECITYTDFMDGHPVNPIIIYNTSPIKCGLILQRAKEKSLAVYHQRTNNCEQFANFCLYGNSESLQVERTEMVVNVLISLIEIKVSFDKSENSTKILNEINSSRKILGINRSEKFEEYLLNRKKNIQ